MMMLSILILSLFIIIIWEVICEINDWYEDLQLWKYGLCCLQHTMTVLLVLSMVALSSVVQTE